MKRVTVLVTHLLGTGHLTRSLILARALGNAGFQAQLISGGLPIGHLDLSGVDFVQLPPVQSDGTSFTTLLDASGLPVTDEQMQQRILAIEHSLQASPPDVLITELFPFGRRVLRKEFLAALSVARAMQPRPLILSSIRDILAPPSNEKKAIQAEAWLDENYDGVLVHSDPHVVPLEASWPVTPPISRLLRYTGFIAPAPPVPDPASSAGAREIIVTAGGGPVGRRLFETAIGAARLGTESWRLLVGGGDAAQVCTRLNAMADGAPVVAEPLRADYRQMLMRCAAAVGQCGYNTAIDWLQAGVPGVFVPFAEAGEVEQSLRAASLQERYGFGVVQEDELTPEALSSATQAALARGRLDLDLSFEGADQTSRIVFDMLATRA